MDNPMVYLLGVILIGSMCLTFITVTVRNGFSGLKLMLLGISIILCGGIMAVTPNSNYFGGIEYLIVCIGLILSFIGFWKKD